MKLYQYDDIKKLNQALGSFAKNGVPVAKVKLLTVGDKVQYFVLADPKEVYQKPKVESKTEDEAKKTIKKEKKIEEKKEEKKEPVKAE
jgi:hypothetical protein